MIESITADDILKEIKNLIKFPNATVCKHYVTSCLLSLLDKKGYTIQQELAKAVVEADDETTLKILSSIK